MLPPLAFSPWGRNGTLSCGTLMTYVIMLTDEPVVYPASGFFPPQEATVPEEERSL